MASTEVTIAVADFRGCDHAEVVCNPIAAVAGRNAAGKSSLAQGVATALCGKPPVPGRNVGNALVRFGAGGSTIEVRDDAGVVTMSWPSGQAVKSGEPPTASEWACGLDSIASPTVSARDRARTLSEYLRADPTREDLADALSTTEMGHETIIQAVWDLIQQHGWDGAESLRRERGAQMKGQWRQVTGQTWGSRVAAAWRPDLAELDPVAIEAEAHRARNAVDQAIAAAAVSQAERERVEDDARELDARSQLRREALTKVEEAERAYQRAQQERQALPALEAERSVPCPHCGQPIVIHRDLAETRVEKAQVVARLDDAELRHRRMALATADGNLEHASGELTTARRAAEQARVLVEASEKARERLSAWPRAVETGTDLETAKAHLARAEKRLAECKMKREADDIHGKIEGNDIVIGLLAGDGLRATKLARVLGTFVNQTLLRLTMSAGWGAVLIDPEMAISYAGRPYGLLSSSEQYRVRVVLQVAMAQLEGATLVVIDAADVLDAPGRGGLFGLLAEADIPALVCMTLSKPEQMPDLARSGSGTSYWIEDGVAAPISAQARAA